MCPCPPSAVDQLISLVVIAVLFSAFAWWDLAASRKSHAAALALVIGFGVALATGAIWLASPSRTGPDFALPSPLEGMVFRPALIPAILGLVVLRVVGHLSLRHNGRGRRHWPWR